MSPAGVIVPSLVYSKSNYASKKNLPVNTDPQHLSPSEAIFWHAICLPQINKKKVTHQRPNPLGVKELKTTRSPVSYLGKP